MLIWILDADISFSVALREKIRTFLKKKYPKLKVEIFHEVESFESEVLRVKKNKKSSPDLVILDTHVGDDVTLDYALNAEDDILRDKLVYCSSMSYGLFTEFFEKEDSALPPFVQKQRIDNELEGMLSDRLLKKEGETKDPQKKPVLPKIRQARGKLKSLLEKQRSLYYEHNLDKQALQEFLENLETISEAASVANHENLRNRAKELLSFFGRAPRPGPLRIKREVRNFLAEAEKILESLDEQTY